MPPNTRLKLSGDKREGVSTLLPPSEFSQLGPDLPAIADITQAA